MKMKKIALTLLVVTLFTFTVFGQSVKAANTNSKEAVQTVTKSEVLKAIANAESQPFETIQSGDNYSVNRKVITMDNGYKIVLTNSIKKVNTQDNLQSSLSSSVTPQYASRYLYDVTASFEVDDALGLMLYSLTSYSDFSYNGSSATALDIVAQTKTRLFYSASTPTTSKYNGNPAKTTATATFALISSSGNPWSDTYTIWTKCSANGAVTEGYY